MKVMVVMVEHESESCCRHLEYQYMVVSMKHTRCIVSDKYNFFVIIKG